MPQGYGAAHDLSAVYGAPDRLWVTCNQGKRVLQFDKTKETFLSCTIRVPTSSLAVFIIKALAMIKTAVWPGFTRTGACTTQNTTKMPAG